MPAQSELLDAVIAESARVLLVTRSLCEKIDLCRQHFDEVRETKNSLIAICTKSACGSALKDSRFSSLKISVLTRCSSTAGVIRGNLSVGVICPAYASLVKREVEPKVRPPARYLLLTFASVVLRWYN